MISTIQIFEVALSTPQFVECKNPYKQKPRVTMARYLATKKAWCLQVTYELTIHSKYLVFSVK